MTKPERTAAAALPPMIVCPTQFELQALQRAGTGQWGELVCCGPGREGIADWVMSREQAIERGDDDAGRSVVLAGLAGAIEAGHPAGAGYCVTAVVDDDGARHFTPPLRTRQSEQESISVMSVRATLTNEAARQFAHARSGAALVDLESSAFAAMCSVRRWPWGIVRGVSDDFSTVMPDDIGQWVDDTGRTRLGVVMRSLLCRPSLIPVVVELRRNATSAMQSVSDVLEQLLVASEK